jgi:hypothetical protein
MRHTAVRLLETAIAQCGHVAPQRGGAVSSFELPQRRPVHDVLQLVYVQTPVMTAQMWWPQQSIRRQSQHFDLRSRRPSCCTAACCGPGRVLKSGTWAPVRAPPTDGPARPPYAATLPHSVLWPLAFSTVILGRSIAPHQKLFPPSSHKVPMSNCAPQVRALGCGYPHSTSSQACFLHSLIPGML